MGFFNRQRVDNNNNNNENNEATTTSTTNNISTKTTPTPKRRNRGIGIESSSPGQKSITTTTPRGTNRLLMITFLFSILVTLYNVLTSHNGGGGIFDYMDTIYSSYNNNKELMEYGDIPPNSKKYELYSNNNNNNIDEEEVRNEATTYDTIGYAVSITGYKKDKSGVLLDQAAVLMYSIHMNSIRYLPKGETKYDYKMYAFVHPEVVEDKDSFSLLEGLKIMGYDVQIKDSPVLKEDIKGNLKEFVSTASCCGEKEFLKLYSYTLLQHKVVVHLDLDCMVLQPLDELYDAIILNTNTDDLDVTWENEKNNSIINAFFTRDYNLVDPPRRKPHEIGLQGGFMVVRPDMEVFQTYKDLILEGEYTVNEGWGGPTLRYGGYYGAAQIQGLCSFFYGHVRPNTSIELDRCLYNFMGDAPRHKGKCRTQEDECKNCQTDVTFEQVKTIHFTLCHKPWWCFASEEYQRNKGDRYTLGHTISNINDTDIHALTKLCLGAHAQWFRSRYLFETDFLSLHDKNNETETNFPTTYGYCTDKRGKHTKYKPLQLTSNSTEKIIKIKSSA